MASEVRFIVRGGSFCEGHQELLFALQKTMPRA